MAHSDSGKCESADIPSQSGHGSEFLGRRHPTKPRDPKRLDGRVGIPGLDYHASESSLWEQRSTSPRRVRTPMGLRCPPTHAMNGCGQRSPYPQHLRALTHTSLGQSRHSRHSDSSLLGSAPSCEQPHRRQIPVCDPPWIWTRWARGRPRGRRRRCRLGGEQMHVALALARREMRVRSFIRIVERPSSDCTIRSGAPRVVRIDVNECRSSFHLMRRSLRISDHREREDRFIVNARIGPS
jgi:hypothetical protein